MWRRIVTAALLGSVLSNPVRAAGIETVLAGISWGESPEALQRQLGARGFAVLRPIDFGDSYAPLVMRNADIGGVRMIAYFQIDKATHGLKRVQLERPRHMVNPGAFRAVFTALDAEYGAPSADCGALPGPATAYQGTAEDVWRRDGLVIRAVFRDTTLEALDGCFSPACGLTAQLLVRLSPATGEDGRCPATPAVANSRLRQ